MDACCVCSACDEAGVGAAEPHLVSRASVASVGAEFKVSVSVARECIEFSQLFFQCVHDLVYCVFTLIHLEALIHSLVYKYW